MALQITVLFLLPLLLSETLSQFKLSAFDCLRLASPAAKCEDARPNNYRWGTFLSVL